MKLKSSSFEALLKVYKALALSLMVTNTCATIYIPKWITPHMNVTEHTARVITFLASLFVSSKILTYCNHMWIRAHDEMLEQEVYNIQQALSNIGIVDVKDIDTIIQILNDIKNAKNPDEKKIEEDKQKQE